MPLAHNLFPLQETLDTTCKSSRILIVEDDPNYRFFLKQTLNKDGYLHIEQAANGNEGYHKTLEFKPDIVILDLMMPICNGIEYCERIRILPQFADMPILVQTGVGDLEMHQNSFRAGATDLLTKPINAEEFLARTRAHLERYELARNMKSYRELFQEEKQTADSMQRYFIPTNDELKETEGAYGLRISSYNPFSGNSGAEMWNIIALNPQEALIYVGEFSGQGISSAMQSLRYHTIMQRIAEETTDPGFALTHLNQRLRGIMEEGQHASIFIGVINIATDTLTYAAAGTHNPLLIDARIPHFESLTCSHSPLNGLNVQLYTSKQASFAAGEHLFLYSDEAISQDTAQVAEMACSCLTQGKTIEEMHQAFYHSMHPTIEAKESLVSDNLLMMLVSRL